MMMMMMLCGMYSGTATDWHGVFAVVEIIVCRTFRAAPRRRLHRATVSPSHPAPLLSYACACLFQHLSDRLAINLFHALMLDVVTPLRSTLLDSFVVELMSTTGEAGDKDALLAQHAAIERDRLDLDNKIVQMRKALADLKKIQAER